MGAMFNSLELPACFAHHGQGHNSKEVAAHQPLGTITTLVG